MALCGLNNALSCFFSFWDDDILKELNSFQKIDNQYLSIEKRQLKSRIIFSSKQFLGHSKTTSLKKQEPIQNTSVSNSNSLNLRYNC